MRDNQIRSYIIIILGFLNRQFRFVPKKAALLLLLQPGVKLIRIISKTCSDILVFLGDRNVQRNVGLASAGRAPQQRKMQNAKGIEKKIVTPNCQVLCRSLAMYVLPVMDVSQIHDWIHDWNCEFMTGGLILINLAQGGWGSHPDALNQIG